MACLYLCEQAAIFKFLLINFLCYKKTLFPVFLSLTTHIYIVLIRNEKHSRKHQNKKRNISMPIKFSLDKIGNSLPKNCCILG